MNDGRELIQKYVEDREQLSDDELQSLVAALRLWPNLVVELKDQLIVDELLAQKCDLARWHFISQIEQRLRDKSEGFQGIQTGDLRLPERPAKPRRGKSIAERRRSLAANTEPVARTHRNWKRTPFLLAIVALIAVGVWSNLSRVVIGVVEEAQGDVQLLRADQSYAASKLASVYFGDRLVTGVNAAASVRFPDGTSIRLGADSEIDLRQPSHTVPGKHIFVSRGRVTADVAPQPPGEPMILESDRATAEVVGTSLIFQVAPEQTNVTVTDGTVQVVKKEDQQSVRISRDEFAVVSAEALATAPIYWPSDRSGLIFLFETNDKPNFVRSISTGMDRSFPLRPRGSAHLNHDFGMVLTGGAFLAEDVDGEILSACRQTNQLSIEATIRPSLATQLGPARIVTFSTTVLERDFTLGQLDDELIIRIRTPQTGLNGVKGVDSGLPICKLIAGETHHVIVSYRPGKVVCYLNGKQVFESGAIDGDFRDWSAQHLLFGDEYAGERNWAGSLEGVAIYNRFIEPGEAKRNALQYEHLRQTRLTVPQASIVAKLIEKSSLPTIDRIRPNRSALVVCKYEVKEVLDGHVDKKELSVAQWAILDGANQPIVTTPIGAEMTLLLEPLERNPQALRYFVSDDFPDDEAQDRYFEIRR